MCGTSWGPSSLFVSIANYTSRSSHLHLGAYLQSHDKCFSASGTSGRSAFSPFCAAAWFRSLSSSSDTGRRFGSGALTARRTTVNWSKQAFIQSYDCCADGPAIAQYRLRSSSQTLPVPISSITTFITTFHDHAYHSVGMHATLEGRRYKCDVLVRNRSTQCMYLL